MWAEEASTTITPITSISTASSSTLALMRLRSGREYRRCLRLLLCSIEFDYEFTNYWHHSMSKLLQDYQRECSRNWNISQLCNKNFIQSLTWQQWIMNWLKIAKQHYSAEVRKIKINEKFSGLISSIRWTWLKM